MNPDHSPDLGGRHHRAGRAIAFRAPRITVTTIKATPTTVERGQLVAFDDDAYGPPTGGTERRLNILNCPEALVTEGNRIEGVHPTCRVEGVPNG